MEVMGTSPLKIIMNRIILSSFVFIVLCRSLVFAKTYDLSQISKCKTIIDYNANTTIDKMDTVTFGLYPQSDASGVSKEPIEWIVLEKQGNMALLLSKYILDCKKYNEVRDDITWENCTLRNWLNNSFYYNAFSSRERNQIKTINVINNNNIDFELVNGGNNTNDNVFCLSIDEIMKFFGNGVKAPWGYQLGKNVETKGTNYARLVDNGGHNLYVKENSGGNDGNSNFWLRTPGVSQLSVADIQHNGYMITVGFIVDSYNIGVRPALWVNY